MSSYLDQLPLSETEKRAVASFGASSLEALWSLIQAARQAAESFLGKELTDRIVRAIEEKDRLGLCVLPRDHPPRYPLGAITYRGAPSIARPVFDVVERDRLFARLQRLRQHPAPLASEVSEASEIENRLNAMLEGQ